MGQNTGTLVLLLIVWLASGIAGIMFIREALRGKRGADPSRLRRAMDEARFRMRLAAGIVLILFVISGVVWFIFHGAG